MLHRVCAIKFPGFPLQLHRLNKNQQQCIRIHVRGTEMIKQFRDGGWSMQTHEMWYLWRHFVNLVWAFIWIPGCSKKAMSRERERDLVSVFSWMSHLGYSAICFSFWMMQRGKRALLNLSWKRGRFFAWGIVGQWLWNSTTLFASRAKKWISYKSITVIISYSHFLHSCAKLLPDLFTLDTTCIKKGFKQWEEIARQY